MAIALDNLVEEKVYIDSKEKICLNTKYSLFSEQFLEKPEKYELGTGPTICTIKKIPAFDDW